VRERREVERVHWKAKLEVLRLRCAPLRMTKGGRTARSATRIASPLSCHPERSRRTSNFALQPARRPALRPRTSSIPPPISGQQTVESATRIASLSCHSERSRRTSNFALQPARRPALRPRTSNIPPRSRDNKPLSLRRASPPPPVILSEVEEPLRLPCSQRGAPLSAPEPQTSLPDLATTHPRNRSLHHSRPVRLTTSMFSSTTPAGRERA
jgi:hypothetical protein